ncbi:family 43 glycosylhydrolase [Segatella copri]|uniref:family 43 glycosylhydrolase n=1 Tax=Segatella copri TaxID=165179 RepID=UPI0019313155|nr:glycoside hydrolase 43 family protein [Segatella copri]MBM0142753.1 glycosyl hydrolase 43 family protein [Segatella copri]
MNKLLIATFSLALCAGSISASAQNGQVSAQKKLVTQQQPSRKTWSADNGNGTYTNPLFYDEFSDPDIIRVGEDYYLAGTTMHSVPGLVVLHSKDLVNWEFSSYCFDRFDDSDDFNLRNGKEAYGQGIWAPAIRYHNGKFYIFSNINGHGLQVFISDSAKGPWKHHQIKGDIYDLSVLFDDDGKIYAIHKYGNVTVTELKPDLSGPVEGSSKVVIPEGNAMGEGHHIYKINGMYYILSADYSPMGRMQCARSKSIWGPYETCVISERESFGYSAAWTVNNVGLGRPVPEDGFKFKTNKPSDETLICSTIHQGGIVQAPNGKWWGVSMQDFNAVGRTVCLSPVTWVDGWPYFGLEKNLGRSPRTWFKPNDVVKTPVATYDRCDDFSGKTFKSVWQWNHNPNDKMWSLNKERKGWLRLHSLPAKQLLWAKNSLTQRAIGPVSYTSVKLDASKLKAGDEAGLGVINMPYASLGVVKTDKGLALRCYDQNTNKEVVKPLDKKVVWLRLWGDYDKSQLQYSYSLDGKTWENIGEQVLSPYQLKTFQGVRVALYAFNKKEVNGGVADFDDFKVEEPMADRTANLPIGKTVRFFNLADGNLMNATRHGVMHNSWNKKDMSNQVKFVVEARGQGKVALKTADGRYVYIAGAGLSGDVRLAADAGKAEEFVWQDMLYNHCMLLSLKTQRYVGKHPKDGSPYSADFQGADAGMKNGCVFAWEVVE